MTWLNKAVDQCLDCDPNTQEADICLAAGPARTLPPPPVERRWGPLWRHLLFVAISNSIETF